MAAASMTIQVTKATAVNLREKKGNYIRRYRFRLLQKRVSSWKH